MPILKTKAADPATAQAKQSEAPALFKAPAFAQQLKEAETHLAGLEGRYQQAAFDSGLSGGSGDVVALETELSKARAAVARCQAAHKAALAHDDQARRRILAEHNKSVIRSCRSHLQARDAAAAAMSAALATAIEHFKVMVERSSAAKAAVPEWGLQRGRKVEPDELYKLVQKEIARIYGPPPSIDGKCPFPGGDSLDISNRLQPQILPPLADVLREATTGIIESLTGKVVE